jgi:hypothetical protein
MSSLLEMFLRMERYLHDGLQHQLRTLWLKNRMSFVISNITVAVFYSIISKLQLPIITYVLI